MFKIIFNLYVMFEKLYLKNTEKSNSVHYVTLLCVYSTESWFPQRKHVNLITVLTTKKRPDNPKNYYISIYFLQNVSEKSESPDSSRYRSEHFRLPLVKREADDNSGDESDTLSCAPSPSVVPRTGQTSLKSLF
jgi:hypothetical protein